MRSLCHEVEPRHSTTPLIRPYLYYDHLFVPRTKALIFSCINNSLIRPPCYYDQTITFSSPQSFQEKILHITLYPIARGCSKQRNMKVAFDVSGFMHTVCDQQIRHKKFRLELVLKDIYYSRIITLREGRHHHRQDHLLSPPSNLGELRQILNDVISLRV